MSPKLTRRGLLCAVPASVLLLRVRPGAASPEEVPAPLMAGLAAHAQAFEEMKRRGGFTVEGKLEQLDGDGKVSETKEVKVRVTPRPAQAGPLTEVLRYVENGADKTAEAREKAAKKRASQARQRKDLKLPFHASEQARYTFALVERHAVHPTRAKIEFNPKQPAEDAIKGSAWVDTATGSVLSVGFSLSKNPIFIDHVEVQVAFGLATPLGRAPSEISFDGRGGFLFIHKHFRGTATISSPRVAF